MQSTTFCACRGDLSRSYFIAYPVKACVIFGNLLKVHFETATKVSVTARINITTLKLYP